MQHLIDFSSQLGAGTGQSSCIVANQRPDCRGAELRAISAGRLPSWCKNMRTAVHGDSRSRVPSCGRRYADAPTAVLFTASGGGRISSVLRATAVHCRGRAQDCGLYAVLP